MTTHPVYIVLVLLLIEGILLTLAARPIGKRLFKFLPSMFWIYCLPMLATTVKLLPDSSPVYDWIGRWILPAALVLLLLSADIRGIGRLGLTALGMMAFSVCGVMTGAVAVALIFRSGLPPEAWKGIGSLCASWIGGSANMIAVGKAVEAPESILSSIVVVDSVVSYCWMALLIMLSVHQVRFDRWNRSRMGVMDDLAGRVAANGTIAASQITLAGVVWMAMIGIAGTFASVRLGATLPAVKNVINPSGYAILLATGIGVMLSFTPARKLESRGSNTIGFAMLYLVLASIGAKTSLGKIDSVPTLLLAGVIWITIHGLFLILGARLLRAPMALAASASQASIGGPASAPVVAGIYHPQLAPVGLLLAVLGNLLGTFLGLFIAQICRWLG